MTQWVPLYQSSEEVIKTEIATFAHAFPDATVWNTFSRGKGYDLLILGNRKPLTIDVVAVLAKLDELPLVAVSLGEANILNCADLLSTFVSSVTDLGPWLRNAEINRDRSLRLQYMAGLTINRYEAAAAYQALLPFRRYPHEVFVVPVDTEQWLRQEFDSVQAPAQ